MLGNIEQFDQLGASESFKVAAKPERLQAIRGDVQGCLKSRMVASGEAASLRGKQLHVSATRPGRTGRRPMPFLGAIADGKFSGFCEGVEADLQLRLLH